ncbi:MAG: deoxyadenosine/deoxycytidine kinase [Clostridiales bacterium]|nr:deoxyadenosine/deoxycytidine kinase [Clostridiales bacterium]
MNRYSSAMIHQYKEQGREHNMAIVIDGIIGAGKSSIGQYLSEALGMPLYQELKSDGEDSLAQRMLDRFYEAPERWSAIIQIMFLNDRFKDIMRIEADGSRAILDRSIYGDELFARTIFDRGQMTADEFAIYQAVLKQMLTFIRVPDLLIYIDVSVDTALHRIAKRNRSTEGDLIPRDYMEDLRSHYENWFEQYNLSPKIRVDLNESAYDENGQIKETFSRQILQAVADAGYKRNE